MEQVLWEVSLLSRRAPCLQVVAQVEGRCEGVWWWRGRAPFRVTAVKRNQIYWFGHTASTVSEGFFRVLVCKASFLFVNCWYLCLEDGVHVLGKVCCASVTSASEGESSPVPL